MMHRIGTALVRSWKPLPGVLAVQGATQGCRVRKFSSLPPADDSSSEEAKDRAWRQELEARKLFSMLRSLKGDARRQMFQRMVQQRTANIFHFNLMISSSRSVKESRETWETLCKSGLKPDVVSYTSMMRSEVKAGNLSAAEKIYSAMVANGVGPNEITHGILIDGHSKHGRLIDVFSAWKRMKQQGLKTNWVIYSSLIDACAKRMDIGRAEKVVEEVIANGLLTQTCVCTSLLNLYGRSGDVEKIKVLWEQFLQEGGRPDSVMVNTCLSVTDKISSLEDVLALYNQVKDGNWATDLMTYTIMIEALSKRGMVKEAMKYVEELRESKLELDGRSVCVLVDVFARTGDIDNVEKFLDHICEMRRKAMQQGEDSKSLSVTTNKDVLDAFNSALTGFYLYSTEDKTAQLVKRLRKLSDEGISLPPDRITYTILISHIDLGVDTPMSLKEIDKQMRAEAITPDKVYVSTLITRLVGAHAFMDAVDVFQMAHSDMISPYSACLDLRKHEFILDLHGMPLPDAITAVEWILRHPRNDGDRDLIIITGKPLTYALKSNQIRRATETLLHAKRIRYKFIDGKGNEDSEEGRIIIMREDWADFLERIDNGEPESFYNPIKDQNKK